MEDRNLKVSDFDGYKIQNVMASRVGDGLKRELVCFFLNIGEGRSQMWYEVTLDGETIIRTQSLKKAVDNYNFI